ncbi:hypothetical protein B8W70_05485 [Pseudomonas sp. 1239]|uniref:hypothetical protein n=1 Tax=unclassified Pseudomonas TaxID=196821 RepID=UPI000B4ECE0B|nr:hypothetical protein [Pseudomonas sp. 1239]OUM33217.1 hypothetical protein B8W70_05485 [Pseudomonas sp. 1239]
MLKKSVTDKLVEWEKSARDGDGQHSKAFSDGRAELFSIVKAGLDGGSDRDKAFVAGIDQIINSLGNTKTLEALE